MTAGWGRRALRVPLVLKIVGANLIAVSLAAWAGLEIAERMSSGRSLLMPILTLVIAVAGSACLAYVALGPVRAITRTAELVRLGDFDARVPQLPLAEDRFEQVGNTINRLLDSVAADRAHMRQLASQVIGAGDRERANLARELHDSTAQALAALSMQLTVMLRETRDERVRERLGELRDIAQEAMEEVRMLAHTLHPRVLDDLGLVAALQNLTRRAQESSGLRVESLARTDEGIPSHVASVLYRVAQESVYNAIRHATATNVRVELTRGESAVRLEVIDDGRGFDVADAQWRRPGMGLFTMRERLSLVGGTMQLISNPNGARYGNGGGTRVVATVPLEVERTNAG